MSWRECVMAALGIQGWKHPEELHWLCEQAAAAKLIVDVGCWRGQTTLAMWLATSGRIVATDRATGLYTGDKARNAILCGANGVAAARLVATGNHLHAWGADTTAILVINTATQRTSGNWITATAAGNVVDYLTASTSPSADSNTSAVYAADPAGGTLAGITVAGS